MYESRTWTNTVSSDVMAPTPVTGDYVGPGDIVSGALGWWGLRAYSSAMVGTNCIRLRRNSDDAEMDFVTLADGSLDVASIATFKEDAGIFCVTLYDQSGNGRDMTQAVPTSQLRFTLDGIGTLPILEEDASDRHLQAAAGSFTQSQPMTISTVAQYFDLGFPLRLLFAGIDADTDIVVGRLSNNAILDAGFEIGSEGISDDWHAVQTVVNGVTSDVYVDGISDPQNAGTATLSNATLFIGHDGTNLSWTSSLTEVGLWGVAFSLGERASMESNQRAYWGI